MFHLQKLNMTRPENKNKKKWQIDFENNKTSYEWTTKKLEWRDGRSLIVLTSYQRL